MNDAVTLLCYDQASHLEITHSRRFVWYQYRGRLRRIRDIPIQFVALSLSKTSDFIGEGENRHIRYPSWSRSLTLKLSTICTVYVLTRMVASDRQKLSFVRVCDRVIFPHFLYFSRECHQLFCRGVFSFFLLDDTFWEKNWSSTFFAKLYWSSTFCSPPILWESVKDLRYASECKLTTIMKTRMVLWKVWLIWAKRIRIKAHQYFLNPKIV